MSGVSTRSPGRGSRRSAKTVFAGAVAVLALVSGCGTGSNDANGPDVPQTNGPQASKHGPFFPECGGVSDQEIGKQTQVGGLVGTAKNSVGCQWLVNGLIVGPHISFNWYRGSPIGRERKTEELTRTKTEDVEIEGHGGFIAYNDTPELGVALCEIGIQFDDDFIEWSISFDRKPFPDSCEVAKELTRQTIVNSQ